MLRGAAAAAGCDLVVAIEGGVGRAHGPVHGPTHGPAQAPEERDRQQDVEQGVAPPAAAAALGQEAGCGDEDLECFAWVCALDPHTGAEGTARSASFALPPALSALVRRGAELGDADDALFGRRGGKRGSGTIGLLSNGVLDRTEYYVSAVVCALLPYMQPQLYGSEYGRLLGEGQQVQEQVSGQGA